MLILDRNVRHLRLGAIVVVRGFYANNFTQRIQESNFSYDQSEAKAKLMNIETFHLRDRWILKVHIWSMNYLPLRIFMLNAFLESWYRILQHIVIWDPSLYCQLILDEKLDTITWLKTCDSASLFLFPYQKYRSVNFCDFQMDRDKLAREFRFR